MEDRGNDGDRLARYHRKRRFDTTDEPRGESAGPGAEPSFVIQIHDARRMHFDFRLEVDGVLRSWAVPRGPSTDPGDRRLAVPTEDHPLEYREYEGVIASGEYGAGPVIVWDQGTYRPLGGGGAADFSAALDRGHASFRLDGRKLRGAYALTRFRDGRDGSAEAWLLVRKTGPGSSRSGPATPDPRRARSARTGRTLSQVARGTPERSMPDHGSGRVHRSEGNDHARRRP
ncbi:Putative DNA ligase-like protein [Streptomyces sp. S4.7]|uniref:DNA polymerase ligase N-terminal domain-containing protein n=1 Tax=Streptomyces sp. S4.7 TaxID=2705439 RepID=UPI001398B0E6|nr:DNA polymerase ligase N-terminal domain-containing protein [Streptomyces sp. S4.7]QHY93787.1 Putative DNA ligase-like protein [Streptomyces sp. S4.7]